MANKTLIFSDNWNNKLNCKSFSTVRIHNPNKYILLNDYQIILNPGGKKESINFGLARLQVIQPFYLDKVTVGVSFIDANMSKIDFIKMVKTMYKNFHINFSYQKMVFLVFQYIEE